MMIQPQRLWDWVEGRVPLEDMPENLQDAIDAYRMYGAEGPPMPRLEALICILDFMKGTPEFEELMLMEQDQFLACVKALLWDWERQSIEA